MPRNGNCKPGTLVDSAVTSPYFQCFYLQSHDGLKGTAKSSHYFVLENEMGKTENVLQEFVSPTFITNVFLSTLRKPLPYNSRANSYKRLISSVTPMFAQP